MTLQPVLFVVLCVLFSASHGIRFDYPDAKYCPVGQFAFGIQVQELEAQQQLGGFAFYCENIGRILGFEPGIYGLISDKTVRMEFTESQGNWDVSSRCPDLSGIVGVNMSFGQNGILKSVTPTCGAPFDLEQGRTAMLKVGFGEGLPSLGSIESTTCDQGLAVCGFKHDSIGHYEPLCCVYFDNFTVSYVFEQLSVCNNTHSSSPVGTEYYLPLAFKKGNRVTRNISDQEMAAIKTGVFEGIDYHHDILHVINADPRMEGDSYMMLHFKEEIKKAFENPQNPKIVFMTGARTHTSIHQLTIYVGEHRIGLKKIIRYVNGKQVPNTSTGCGFNYIVFSCLLVTLFGI